MAGNFLDTSFMMVGQDAGTQAQLSELKQGLEKGSDEVKIETMKRILQQMLQGDPMPSLLMVRPALQYSSAPRTNQYIVLAHHTIRNAFEIETTQETTLPLLRDMSKARLAREASSRVDSRELPQLHGHLEPLVLIYNRSATQ